MTNFPYIQSICVVEGKSAGQRKVELFGSEELWLTSKYVKVGVYFEETRG